LDESAFGYNQANGLHNFAGADRGPAAFVRDDVGDALFRSAAANAGAAVNSPSDIEYMRRALILAQRAAQDGEVPIGAVLVLGNEVIGEGWNQPIGLVDPTAHAEIVALRAAARRQRNYRLTETTLYATLEPCSMCMGAVLNARVSRVVFGAWDAKAGACGSVIDLPREPRLTRGLDVFGGVCGEESAALLRQFFESRR
jgi:tRNA(adenine34) deaminase